MCAPWLVPPLNSFLSESAPEPTLPSWSVSRETALAWISMFPTRSVPVAAFSETSQLQRDGSISKGLQGCQDFVSRGWLLPSWQAAEPVGRGSGDGVNRGPDFRCGPIPRIHGPPAWPASGSYPGGLGLCLFRSG